MRSAARALLYVVIVQMALPASVGAADAILAVEHRLQMDYTQTWCSYERSGPDRSVPGDVDCGSYQLTDDEARNYYRLIAARSNRVLVWVCLPTGASWDRERRAIRTTALASKRFALAVDHVRWPAKVQRDADRIARANLDEYAVLMRLQRYGTETSAALSGEVGNLSEVRTRASNAAYSIRSRLGLNAPPRFKATRDCP